MIATLINPGLFRKSAREIAPITLVLGLTLMVFEGFIAYVVPTFQRELSEQFMSIPFFQQMFSAMLGVDAEGSLTPQVFSAIAWVHPVVLALVWAHAIIVGTRIPAGEVDRGTIDVLLGLPVSRGQIYRADGLAWLIGGAIMVAFAWIGNVIGSAPLEAALRPAMGSRVPALVNLLLLYMAVGGLAALASAASNRRTKAILVTFIVLLVSFIINYLAQFWAPMQKLEWLSLLDYYRPVLSFQRGTWPWRDLLVLLVLAGVLRIVAGQVFRRRDLCTV